MKNHKEVFSESVKEELVKYKDMAMESSLYREESEKEKLELKSEVEYLKDKLAMENKKKNNSAAIEGKQANNDASKFDYYRIAIAVVDNLQESFTGKKYTRSDIQACFLKELDCQSSYKEDVLVFAADADCNLRSWAMEAIRKKLGDMAETEGGRPRKNSKVDSE